ncbi:MAG: c-type cytochrome [Planctomycetes bacterium]|nr:c-type cytochrome [Planctomycetota bacterium]
MFEFSLTSKQLLAVGIGAALALTLLPQGEDPRITRGRALFDKPFRAADGVGAPEMNADSCRGCHRDPIMGGAGGLELNVTRCGNDNGGAGPFTAPSGGQVLSKLYPPHIAGREEPGGTFFADVFEQRQTPTLLGSGLIDTILAPEILANEDPFDANSDGIYGVARRLQVNAFEEIGRFGWKAQMPRLADFTHDALFGELGITTPRNGRGFGSDSDHDNVADPEISSDAIDDLVIFMGQLPAPERKGSTDPRVIAGEQLFTDIGCAKCHIPVLNGANGPVPLYSNLLLHNVMPAGYRGMAEPGAGVGFFRTPPLWGIGDTAPYMHDGRAEDLPAAILAHDGEATAVRLAYESRTAAEREALILFLGDL